MHNKPIEVFLQELASNAPTPGGGGAAALMGATGAALVAMVANLTLGKKGYEEVTAEMQLQLDEAMSLKQQFKAMMNDDVEAFNGLMGAYRLPKDTDEQKALRSQAIQKGLVGATEAPLECARACAQGIRLAMRSAKTGNTQVISDAGVAVLALQAGLRSAALNVDINAPSIKDRAYADAAVAELKGLLDECLPLAEEAYQVVKGRLG
jgi:formiminotetrahydrofolate cyclodeaminase